MTALRSILLHFDSSPRCAMRTALARALAVQHDAAVTALYATTPSVLEVPFAYAEGAGAVMPFLEQLDADRREQARRLFAHSATPGKLVMEWRVLGLERPIPGVVRHALCSDLLVLGQHDRHDTQSGGVPADFVASVLLASGKPALVVPCLGDFADVGKEVLIAWKPTREAARALTAAMPLLHGARRIHLAAEADTVLRGAGASEVEAYLRRHGVGAPIERHAEMPADAPGEGLLSLAADAGADLLVMGCYGHGRIRELILGGATRTVLGSMTLPVLMVH
jgi:nucleotide-binding universal stress UspA family protein